MPYRGAYSGGGVAASQLAGGGRLFRSGVYYAPMMISSDTTATPNQNQEYAVRFVVGALTTFDRIGLEVTTGAGSNVVRLGIRADDGTNYPGAVVNDAGTIDASTLGFKEITISQALPAGQYWLTATLQGGTGAQIRSRTNDPFIGQSTTSTQNTACWTQSGVTGALGSFSSTPSSTTIGPKILLRAA